MSLAELHDRLDQRFRLLTGGSRTALERQQTLRATVGWSYSLLTAAERVLLGRLSVFAGSFDLDAAEAVCGFGDIDALDVSGLLGSLVDKSLVVAEPTADWPCGTGCWKRSGCSPLSGWQKPATRKWRRSRGRTARISWPSPRRPLLT